MRSGDKLLFARVGEGGDEADAVLVRDLFSGGIRRGREGAEDAAIACKVEDIGGGFCDGADGLAGETGVELKDVLYGEIPLDARDDAGNFGGS